MSPSLDESKNSPTTKSENSATNSLFTDIRSLLQENFNYSRVCNVPRSCNSYAHELASMGMSWDPGQSWIWTDPFPEFVNVFAARDLAEHASINARP